MMKNLYTPEEIAEYFDRKSVMETRRAAYESGVGVRTIYNFKKWRNDGDYKLSTLIKLSNWIIEEH